MDKHNFNSVLAATIRIERSKLIEKMSNSIGLLNLEDICKRHGTNNVNFAVNEEAKRLALKIVTGR